MSISIPAQRDFSGKGDHFFFNVLVVHFYTGEMFAKRRVNFRRVSERLGLTGRLDLAIATPSHTAANAQAIVVEYKHSEKQAGAHFQLQLAAYALLLEEAWQLPVRQSFLYAIPLRRAEAIPITPALRKKVAQIIAQIHHMVEQESMPPVPVSQRRCATCEFRRFCNDVI